MKKIIKTIIALTMCLTTFTFVNTKVKAEEVSPGLYAVSTYDGVNTTGYNGCIFIDTSTATKVAFVKYVDATTITPIALSTGNYDSDKLIVEKDTGSSTSEVDYYNISSKNGFVGESVITYDSNQISVISIDKKAYFSPDDTYNENNFQYYFEGTAGQNFTVNLLWDSAITVTKITNNNAIAINIDSASVEAGQSTTTIANQGKAIISFAVPSQTTEYSITIEDNSNPVKTYTAKLKISNNEVQYSDFGIYKTNNLTEPNENLEYSDKDPGESITAYIISKDDLAANDISVSGGQSGIYEKTDFTLGTSVASGSYYYIPITFTAPISSLTFKATVGGKAQTYDVRGKYYNNDWDSTKINNLSVGFGGAYNEKVSYSSGSSYAIDEEAEYNTFTLSLIAVENHNQNNEAMASKEIYDEISANASISVLSVVSSETNPATPTIDVIDKISVSGRDLYTVNVNYGGFKATEKYTVLFKGSFQYGGVDYVCYAYESFFNKEETKMVVDENDLETLNSKLDSFKNFNQYHKDLTGKDIEYDEDVVLKLPATEIADTLVVDVYNPEGSDDVVYFKLYIEGTYNEKEGNRTTLSSIEATQLINSISNCDFVGNETVRKGIVLKHRESDSGDDSNIYSVTNCSFSGYDIAIHSYQGLIGSIFECTIENCKVGIQIDMQDVENAAENSVYSYNDFILCDKAFVINHLVGRITPYKFSITNNNFYNDPTDDIYDFYAIQEGNYYFYENYYGDIKFENPDKTIIKYLEESDIIDSTSRSARKYEGEGVKIITNPCLPRSTYEMGDNNLLGIDLNSETIIKSDLAAGGKMNIDGSIFDEVEGQYSIDMINSNEVTTATWKFEGTKGDH